MLVALAVSSFLVGTLIGATGVGGVLLIPAIMFFGGLGTHEAMATALFSFLFAGIVATVSYQRYGTIDWRVTLPVVAGDGALAAVVSGQRLRRFGFWAMAGSSSKTKMPSKLLA